MIKFLRINRFAQKDVRRKLFLDFVIMTVDFFIFVNFDT